MPTIAESKAGPLVRLTRRYRFSASHRLNSPLLSKEQNDETYGKCNNPYGHGHDYVLDVTVAARVDPLRGRVIAVDTLDAFVRRIVVDPFDRHDLNTEVEEFAALVPTTENLAAVVAARLASAWEIAFATPGAPALEKVRIWETRNNIFEVSVGKPDGDCPATAKTKPVECYESR